ncbi:methyltransferase domain-containing protein [Cryptosporangium sp. NPDC051539]|uniref:methyltransferase domain-containing protein n=1 Tax=Cryptosporangium sp. NPDC051539 TaxID=3363962 RepID=UPI0037A8DF71
MDAPDRCLVCTSTELEPVVSLTPTPPANDVTSSPEASRAQERYPLDLVRCAGCGLVQLRDVVPRDRLFADYRYATGAAPGLVAHCRELADTVIGRLGLGAGDSVLEVGSNDGTQLGFFAQRGLWVLGVDPAVELARAADRSGVPTVGAPFGKDSVDEVLSRIGPVDVVLGSNVVAHVSDVGGVLHGMRQLLKPAGRAVIEVAHVLPMMRHGMFEFVYHEHLSYFSLHVVARAAEASGLRLVDADLIPTQGGSLRCWLARDDDPAEVSPGVARILHAEVEAGERDGTLVSGFSDRVKGVSASLHDVLGGLTATGRRICGFGASARAVTLLAQAEVAGDIDFIVDDNPRKVGCFTPADGIPIVPVSRLRPEDVDYCVLFAWNFGDTIRARHRAFTAGGGAFVLPFPDLTVVRGR